MKLQNVWALILAGGVTAGAPSMALAQGSSAPAADAAAQTGDATQNSSSAQQPVPAYGQENAPLPISENPPLSGLDLPGLEPHSAPVSYIQPGATVSQSVDSNVGNSLGGGSVISVTRALGSATLQRLWSHYALGADYIGGAGYYNQTGVGWRALQQMDVDQKITWKRGEFSIRDSFSYLPDGNFGGAYGALGSQGIASLGNTSVGQYCGGGVLANLGEVQHIVNCSEADVSQFLTPKSAVTAAGGYSFTHFYGSNSGLFIGSSEVSAQAGYNRLLTPHTQVALEYAYQGFDFSTVGTAFHTHVIEAVIGHRISGRMDFLAGAGPQISKIDVCALFLGTQCFGGRTSDTRLGVAAQARLRYRFPKTSLDLGYTRQLTSGSGFFAGAQSDIARLDVSRPITRVWGAFADLGYSRNSRQQIGTAGTQGTPGTIFDSGFAGFGARRAFGHDFHFYASYQFNELAFDRSFCATGTACNRIGNRHVVSFGLDWTPRPIRLD